MATMFTVTADGFDVFDAEEAHRRLLGRGICLPNSRAKFDSQKSWAEVRLVLATIHPDARCATGEEFFLRLLADVWDKSGQKGKNPIVEAFQGKLFDADFSVNTAMVRRPPNSSAFACPLMIAEIDYSPDVMTAVVVVPAKWVKGLAKATIESAAWDAPSSRNDDARGGYWKRRNAEIRLVQAIERVAPDKKLGGYQASPHQVAWHAGAIYAAPRSGPLVKYDASWKPHELPGFKRSIQAKGLYADADSLWVVMKDQQVQLKQDKVVERRKDMETPMDVAAARLGAQFPFTQFDGGLGVISGAFDIRGTTWVCTARGVFIELRAGQPVRMYVVSNVDDEHFIASGAAFSVDSFFIAGNGIHEIPWAAIEVASKLPPVNAAFLAESSQSPPAPRNVEVEAEKVVMVEKKPAKSTSKKRKPAAAAADKSVIAELVASLERLAKHDDVFMETLIIRPPSGGNTAELPEDWRAFYEACDGMQVRWRHRYSDRDQNALEGKPFTSFKKRAKAKPIGALQYEMAGRIEIAPLEAIVGKNKAWQEVVQGVEEYCSPDAKMYMGKGEIPLLDAYKMLRPFDEFDGDSKIFVRLDNYRLLYGYQNKDFDFGAKREMTLTTYLQRLAQHCGAVPHRRKDFAENAKHSAIDINDAKRLLAEDYAAM